MSIAAAPVARLDAALDLPSEMVAHCGPDGEGAWAARDQSVGLAHRRLKIIDLSEAAAQPMADGRGRVLTYNGEIYNYLELRRQLSDRWAFRTLSDTECILAAYDRYGLECLAQLRGMFAFELWDALRSGQPWSRQSLAAGLRASKRGLLASAPPLFGESGKCPMRVDWDDVGRLARNHADLDWLH
jgi:hypothetical protein